jgi:hypothetical protein
MTTIKEGVFIRDAHNQGKIREALKLAGASEVPCCSLCPQHFAENFTVTINLGGERRFALSVNDCHIRVLKSVAGIPTEIEITNPSAWNSEQK